MGNFIWLKKINPFYVSKKTSQNETVKTNENLNTIYLIRLDIFYNQLTITILYASFMDSLFYKSTLRSFVMFAVSMAYEELILACIGISYYIVLAYTIYLIWNNDVKNIHFLVAIHILILGCYATYGIFMIAFLDRSPNDFATLILTRDTFCESSLFLIRCLTLVFAILVLFAYIRSYSSKNVITVNLREQIKINQSRENIEEISL